MDEPRDVGRRTSRDAWVVLMATCLGFLGGVAGARLTAIERAGDERGTRSPAASAPTAAPANTTGRRAEETVVQVVENASPAVVSIIVSKDVSQSEDVSLNPFGDIFGPSPFRFRVRRPTGKTERRDVGGGSGFIVDADGLIITNRHVANDTKSTIDVVFTSGERVPATVVARDPLLDLAVLNVERKQLPVLSFGDSSTLRVGQSVVAIGNALGEFRNTVSVGVVSGLGRNIQAGDRMTGDTESLDEIIQTDAAINSGNSGGPLLDLAGQVIGVNVAVAGGAENIGFAIPANEAARILADYRKFGRVVRPIVGVRYVLITPALQSELRLSVSEGALIVRGETSAEPAVLPGSAADKAGLREEDIILEVDDQKVNVEHPLQSLIRVKHPGDVVTLKVLSGKERKTVRVTLTEAQ